MQPVLRRSGFMNRSQVVLKVFVLKVRKYLILSICTGISGTWYLIIKSFEWSNRKVCPVECSGYQFHQSLIQVI